MKVAYWLVVLIGTFLLADAQITQPVFPDSLFSTYYHQRATHFTQLPATQGGVIFLGNSITDGGEWAELFPGIQVLNRGISGDYSTGVLNRLAEVYNRKPDKLFLLIGVKSCHRLIQFRLVAPQSQSGFIRFLGFGRLVPLCCLQQRPF